MAQRVTRRFQLATALLVMLFLVCGGLLLAFLVRSLDREAAVRSLHLARTAVHQLEASDLSHVYDFAFWDDSVAFVRGERDRVWADANLGVWSIDTYGFAGAFVFHTDDSLRYAAVAGSESGEGDRAMVPASMPGAELLELTRLARAAPMDDPTPASAYFRRNDAVFLAVAAAITPSPPGPEELRPAPRPVLLYLRQLDAALLDEQSERYLLSGLRLLGPQDGGEPAAEGEDSRLVLAGPDGRPVAHLTWESPHPGDLALSEAVVPGLVALLLLVLVAGAILMTARLAGRTIAGSLEALEHSNAELARRERIALQDRDEAERTSRLKTVFLANVGHELRTPLNAILGFSELLRRQARGPIGDSGYRGYAEDIHAAGEHLLHLIDNILDLSRIEVGAWELDPVPVDLRDATQEVLRFLAPLAERRSVELSVDLEAAPGRIVADRRAVAQIVTNLVGNAIKFTDPGGAVRLRWRAAEPGGAILQVDDSGVGIAAGDLEAILLPFERGSDPASRRREGSGLGLAIVKSLVELHGGRLEIDSAPGRGTSVTVFLPGCREAVAA